MKLFVGLGNPGKQYEKSRHNVGFMVLESFQKIFHGNFSDFKLNKKLGAEISEGLVEQEKVLLIKPQDYYNNSGKVTAAVMKYYDISVDEVFFIHDDIDLPIGALRISKDSQAAGNNGIKDVIDVFGTKNFARIRLGVDNTIREHQEAADFVLQNFSRSDKKILDDLFPVIHEAMVDLVETNGDIVHAQNIYN